MTDLEKLKNTLTEIGVKFKLKTAKTEHGVDVYTSNYDKVTTFDTLLRVKEGIGYPCFFCDFYFLEGKFVNHGCWE